jgi:8-oxo-dGTP pyrophosphatase MutT (NUDIX family)
MAHLNYYVDLCTDAYIVNNKAVLLRLHEKYNFWIAPGGHVDPGEDINQAVLREVWEEVGLKVELIGPSTWTKQDFDINKDLVPPIFVNRHAINEHHDHSSLIFVAKSDSREINPQEEASKNAKCVWVTQEELDQMHKDDSRLRKDVYRYASTALKLIK